MPKHAEMAANRLPIPYRDQTTYGLFEVSI